MLLQLSESPFFSFFCVSGLLEIRFFWHCQLLQRFLIEALATTTFLRAVSQWYPIQATFVLDHAFFLFFFIGQSLRFGMFFHVLFFNPQVSAFFCGI